MKIFRGDHVNALTPFAFIVASLLILTIDFYTGDLTADTATSVIVRTTIVEATVYRTGNVKIVRRGEISLRPGLYRIECHDLPKNIDESSLIVQGAGIDAVIGGVDLRMKEKSKTEPEGYEDLILRKGKLVARKDSLIIQRKSFEQRLSFISALGKYSIDDANENLARESFSLADWKGILDFIQSENVRIEGSFSRINKTLKEIDKEIEWIDSELRRMRVDEGGRIAIISCESSSAGKLALDFVYLVPSASWKPEYIIRHDISRGIIDINYHAALRQRTGEDWKDVAVILSTAMPYIGASSPELRPFYLKKRVIEPIRSKLSVRGGGNEAPVMELDTEIKEAQYVEAAVRSDDYSANFIIKEPVTLPTGIEERRVLVKRAEMPVDIKYYTAPRLSAHLYAVSDLKNTTGIPLLAGKAAVYSFDRGAEGDTPITTFIGDQLIDNTVADGEKFRLHLGIDQGIEIEHRLVKKEIISKVGEKRRKIRYHYLISLESFKGHVTEVTVEDRIPVSTVEDIEVDDVDLEPKPTRKTEQGIVRWVLNLEPALKYDISIDYTIEFPGDWPDSHINLE